MGELESLTKSVNRNSIWNILLRGLGILCSLLLLRLNISYLGATLYGLWATIASISSWANFGDLGISNGLRNELTKAIALNDFSKQLSLIKTAFVMLSIIAVCLFGVLTILTECLFVTGVMDSFLRVPMYITNGFFCFSFLLGIGRTISYSYQKSWLASLAQTGTVISQILILALLTSFSVYPNLITFAIMMGVGTVIGNCIIIGILIKYLINLYPSNIRGKYEKQHRNAIMNIGIQFFVLQLCCLVLYATDNVIINSLFSSDLVTKYSVISTVYNTGENLFSLLLISLWSAVTYAAAKNEFRWIYNETKKIRKIWLLFSCGVVLVSFLFNIIVKVWLGKESIHYETSLIGIFAVYTIFQTFGSIYVNVSNGLGKIKLQMICSVIGAICNIPLSVVFAYYCNMGLLGIKLATLICCVGSMFIIPLYINKFLEQKI